MQAGSAEGQRQLVPSAQEKRNTQSGLEFNYTGIVKAAKLSRVDKPKGERGKIPNASFFIVLKHEESFYISNALIV